MELLPPVGWGDVATRRDVSDVRQDMDHHVTALRQDLTTLRQDMDHLGTDLRHEIALTETRLRAEMAQHQEQTHKDFGGVYKAMSRMMWTVTVSMIGTVVASAGFAFTAGVAP